MQLARTSHLRVLRATETTGNFWQAVTQQQQIMSEAQKKLQELSESYQSLQAGKEANSPRGTISLTTNAEL